jgi:hypothetical protein
MVLFGCNGCLLSGEQSGEFRGIFQKSLESFWWWDSGGFEAAV